MTIEDAILERVRGLLPDQQQQTLRFVEALAQQSPSNPAERSLAELYGVCVDDPIVIDEEGVDANLDDAMEGACD